MGKTTEGWDAWMLGSCFWLKAYCIIPLAHLSCLNPELAEGGGKADFIRDTEGTEGKFLFTARLTRRSLGEGGLRSRRRVRQEIFFYICR